MLWMHGIDQQNKEGSIGKLAGLGFDAVVLPYDTECLTLASDSGLTAYVFSGTYSAAGEFRHDEYLARDVVGNSHVWFGSTCPNQPEVRQMNLDLVCTYASDARVKGIMLDGARFASPCSSDDFEAFFTCFCPVCRNKSMAAGYDFDRMQHDVHRFYDFFKGQYRDKDLLVHIRGGLDLITILQRFPGFADWFDFRRFCTTEHVVNVSQTIKNIRPDIIMGMYIFTPTLAGIVGQNYLDLRDSVDLFSPMIYRNYKEATGPACLNKELARLSRELTKGAGLSTATAAELLASLTGYPLSYLTDANTIDQGLPVSSIQTETEKARSLIGRDRQLVPIVLIDDDRLDESKQAVCQGGADGINYFLYNERYLEQAAD